MKPEQRKKAGQMLHKTASLLRKIASEGTVTITVPTPKISVSLMELQNAARQRFK